MLVLESVHILIYYRKMFVQARIQMSAFYSLTNSIHYANSIHQPIKGCTIMHL